MFISNEPPENNNQGLRALATFAGLTLTLMQIFSMVFDKPKRRTQKLR